ncbi:hypothetical protein ASF48_17375 [Rathayibacter sp. Leaf299]|uniref:hypothetical protein n=1 Tax=Rathayibacter sp. Leaf299 TaxID=1736328 RepID=UPI0006FE6BDA|nr:hypothetical protein [Rathayibacter sp. Leaf299]KQQ18692.1 hypothetical protein ASF48_17375 [Rathayibacter sp. Leaf299]
MSDSITATAPEDSNLRNALAEFASVFSADTAADLGVRLNCAEADAIAGLLRAFGRHETADLWIAEHATADDEGDAHHTQEGTER